MALVTATAALTILSACSGPARMTQINPQSRSVGRTSAADNPPSASASTPRVSLPRCRASQLSAAVGESGPALGTENVVILLRNVSAEPCWLGGLFPLSAGVSGASPARLPFHASADPSIALTPAQVTGPGPVAPDHYGAFIVTECLAVECPQKQPVYRTLYIQVGIKQVVPMPYPAVLRMGPPGTEGLAEPVPSPTGILGH